jgi:hypothetical protein
MNLNTSNIRKLALVLLASSGLVVTGCGSDDEGDTGSLSVLLEAEDAITEGLAAGDDVENVRDGWNVGYDKFIVTVGDVDLHLSTDEEVEAEDSNVFTVDLTQVSGAGLSLWRLDGLRAGRWE